MPSPDFNADDQGPAGGPVPSIGNAPSGRPGRPTRLWIVALVAGLVAGSVAAIGGERTYKLFVPPMNLPANFASLGVYDKPDVLSAVLRKERPGVETKNAAATYGLFGAALGAALGLAGGLARRSGRSGLIAALVGAASGGAIAAIMSAVLVPIFFRVNTDETGMMLGLMVHAGIWVPIGAASGLALGVGLGSRRSMVVALLGGLAGAALGTMAFEVVNAIAFPNARMDRPIPELPNSRILATLCVAVFTSLAAALGLHEGSRKPTAPDELA